MGEVIRLWSGPHEHRMRRPNEGKPRGPATIIILPVITRHDPFKKRRVRVRTRSQRVP